MPHTIAENLQRLQTATANIATAITTKGGTVSQGDGLEEFAADITTIADYKSTLMDLIERDIVSIDIPDTVTEIGAFAFAGCTNLSTVTIPSSITSISNNAFYNCMNLSTITIPNSVTSIGLYAFNGCVRLDTITIPSSVTSIGSLAFAQCSSLETITINKPEGSISGAPWGATAATIEWTG